MEFEEKWIGDETKTNEAGVLKESNRWTGSWWRIWESMSSQKPNRTKNIAQIQSQSDYASW